MKSEKGVTLTTLAVYIMVIFIALITLATATTYFSKNVNEFNTKTTADLEFDKFNLYFIEEVKKTDNKIDEDRSKENEEIVLIHGNKYTFKESSIFLNDSIKIAENITSFRCSWTTDETELQVVTITIEVGETTRTNKYVFSNEKKEEVNNGDYIYEYKNVEVKDTNVIRLDNSIGTTIRNLKIYGNYNFGDYIEDETDPNYGKFRVTITVTDDLLDEVISQVNIYLEEQLGEEEYIDLEKGKVEKIDSWYNHSIGSKYLYTCDGTSKIEIDAGGVMPSKVSLTYYCSEE